MSNGYPNYETWTYVNWMNAGAIENEARTCQDAEHLCRHLEAAFRDALTQAIYSSNPTVFHDLIGYRMTQKYGVNGTSPDVPYGDKLTNVLYAGEGVGPIEGELLEFAREAIDNIVWSEIADHFCTLEDLDEFDEVVSNDPEFWIAYA